MKVKSVNEHHKELTNSLKLRKLDLDNEFSFYQGDYGKQVYADLLDKLKLIQTKLNLENAEDVTNQMFNLITADMKIEILSLIYTIHGQDWSIDVQKELKKYFISCKNPKEYIGDIKSFFIFITKYITDDLSIFSALTAQTK